MQLKYLKKPSRMLLLNVRQRVNKYYAIIYEQLFNSIHKTIFNSCLQNLSDLENNIDDYEYY